MELKKANMWTKRSIGAIALWRVDWWISLFHPLQQIQQVACRFYIDPVRKKSVSHMLEAP